MSNLNMKVQRRKWNKSKQPSNRNKLTEEAEEQKEKSTDNRKIINF